MGKNLKKIMAITLSFTLAVGITGCSKGSGKSSMGRYVEERYESPTNGYAQNLTTLEDGSLVIQKKLLKKVLLYQKMGDKLGQMNL